MNYQFCIIQWCDDICQDEAVNIGLIMEDLNSKELFFKFIENFDRLVCFFQHPFNKEFMLDYFESIKDSMKWRQETLKTFSELIEVEKEIWFPSFKFTSIGSGIKGNRDTFEKLFKRFVLHEKSSS
jgi:hypothetical protein